MFNSFIRRLSSNGFKNTCNGEKRLTNQLTHTNVLRHSTQNKYSNISVNSLRFMSLYNRPRTMTNFVNRKQPFTKPLHLNNNNIIISRKFISTDLSNSNNHNNNNNKKGKKFFYFFGGLLILLTTLSLTNATLLLQTFFKINNILFGDDINNKILLDYAHNNFKLIDIKMPTDNSIKLDWLNGFIEVNDIELILDEDDKFSVKNLKFNINLYKYLFDKNHSTIIDSMEINGVRGKMDTEGLLTHDFDIHNNIKLKDCSFILNKKNSLKIFQLDINKISSASFLLDLMNCEILSGEFNDSLFTIVERQPHLINGRILQLNKDLKNSWEKISRLQMNKININKLHNDAFDWIYDGDLEFVVDLMIPKQHPETEEDGNNNTTTKNNSYLVMDLSMKLYNPRCRVTGDTHYENISQEQIKLITETLNKHLPKQLQQQQHSSLHIYNETIGNNSMSTSLDDSYISHGNNDNNNGGNKINLNSTVTSNDYVIPLNCKLLIDPAKFQLKEVCDRVTDEFYMELTRIAKKEGSENNNVNKKWEAVMVGLLAQILIVGLGTFN